MMNPLLALIACSIPFSAIASTQPPTPFAPWWARSMGRAVVLLECESEDLKADNAATCGVLRAWGGKPDMPRSWRVQSVGAMDLGDKRDVHLLASTDDSTKPVRLPSGGYYVLSGNAEADVIRFMDAGERAAKSSREEANGLYFEQLKSLAGSGDYEVRRLAATELSVGSSPWGLGPDGHVEDWVGVLASTTDPNLVPALKGAFTKWIRSFPSDATTELYIRWMQQRPAEVVFLLQHHVQFGLSRSERMLAAIRDAAKLTAPADASTRDAARACLAQLGEDLARDADGDATALAK